MVYIYYGNELYHHGILGQKWGVRRYQNEDGTLTEAGKRRKSSNTSSDDESGSNTTINKKVVVSAVVGTAAVAAAAVYVHNHTDEIGNAVSKVKNLSISDISEKVVNKGKEYASNTLTGIKEGISEATKEAPKKAAKVVTTGIILNQVKKGLDSAVGKEESAKIFQANDNKKIGKFWKTSDEDKDD